MGELAVETIEMTDSPKASIDDTFNDPELKIFVQPLMSGEKCEREVRHEKASSQHYLIRFITKEKISDPKKAVPLGISVIEYEGGKFKDVKHSEEVVGTLEWAYGRYLELAKDYREKLNPEEEK
ncbi:hypothetical protein ACFLZ7_00545 [Nanoarchaeota archaeon]